MNDEYLWSGTGAPDPDVEALERALAPFRHRGTPLASLPSRRDRAAGRNVIAIDARPTRRRATGVAGVAISALATAATLALVAYTAWFARSMDQGSWEIRTLGGTPRINDDAVGRSARWRVGDRLETDDRSVAEIVVGEIGSVEVRPNSHVTMLRARESEHRVALEHGSIRAVIWSPPGLFFVDTPAAVAVDLGCAYTLDVAPDGSGLLRVEHGWVGFRDDDGRESFIPQGAVCATRRGRGPGTPYYKDAPAPLVSALLAIDFGGAPERQAALTAALDHARPGDALSLWHLLSRTTGRQRAQVFDRLAQLAPPPAGVTRDGVLAGNREMLDAWWDTLGLDSASWWRVWQGRWPR